LQFTLRREEVREKNCRSNVAGKVSFVLAIAVPSIIGRCMTAGPVKHLFNTPYVLSVDHKNAAWYLCLSPFTEIAEILAKETTCPNELLKRTTYELN
jgi:hypothetical protein